LLFTEPTFLFLFLPILLALYFCTMSREHGSYGNWLLLIASVIFYAKGGGSFTWLMLGSITFNYWMAILVDRSRDDRRPNEDVRTRTSAFGRERVRSTSASRLWLAFAVTVNLVVLGVFKYANFFADNVNALFLAVGAPRLEVPRSTPFRTWSTSIAATRQRRRARCTRPSTFSSFRS
jgi:alginate O-acetyltransferase complex protein AlgI